MTVPQVGGEVDVNRTLAQNSNSKLRSNWPSPQVDAHGECAVFQPLKSADGLLKRFVRLVGLFDCVYKCMTNPFSFSFVRMLLPLSVSGQENMTRTVTP